MIRYRIVSAASSEAQEAATFYNDEQIALGEEFLDEIDEKIDRLIKFPRLGRPVGRRVRALLLDRFPIPHHLLSSE